MALTIHLPDFVFTNLSERAARDGKTAESLAAEILEKAVKPLVEKTYDEILAPFRESFAESGMTEEELDALVDEARKEISLEKHGAHV